VRVSFEKILKDRLSNERVNMDRLILDFKERANVSKAKIDAYSNAKYLNIGEFYASRYDNELATRYAAAAPLIYDMIFTIYDVNTRNMALSRFFAMDLKIKASFGKFIDSLAKQKPNLEARIIGMQNDQRMDNLREVLEFINARKLPLVEVDLFGTERRNIAIDNKLGMSFNILLENRVYRAGELANTVTMEQFERILKS